MGLCNALAVRTMASERSQRGPAGSRTTMHPVLAWPRPAGGLGGADDHGEGRRGADAHRTGHADGRADALLLDARGVLLGARARWRAGAPDAAGREADRLPR